MTIYTGAVYNNGSISRIIDLAIACRETGSALEDELARFCRTLETSNAAAWALPSATVSALLDLLSEEFDGTKFPRTPAGFDERLSKAAGGLKNSEFLQLVAGLFRTLDRQALPDFQELPMAAWEVRVRYPRIARFGWWVESGEYDVFEEGLKAGVESEHPSLCRQELPYLAAELQESLLLFPSAEALAAGLQPTIPWATDPILREILQLIHVHFAEQH